MTIKNLLTSLIFLALPLSFITQAHGANDRARFAVRAERIEGSWISTSLSGDGIWLVVKTVGLDLKADGTFIATAQMHGGDEKIIKGKYHLDIGKVRLTPETMSQLICYYQISGGVFTLKNRKHGITAVFERGQLKSAAPNHPAGGLPGMHM